MSMEHKYQNSLCRKRCIYQDKTFKKEKQRSNSVHPIMRTTKTTPTTTNKNSTNGSQQYIIQEVKSSEHSLESEKPTRKELNSETQMSEEDSNGGLEQTKTEKQKETYSSSTSTPRNTGRNSKEVLKAELCRCKRELNDYNNATKELEQKYMKINVELGEMQHRHEQFLANRNAENNIGDNDCSRTGSEYSIKRQQAQVFERANDIVLLVSSKEQSRESDANVENLTYKAQHPLNEQSYTNNRQQILAKVGQYHGKPVPLKAAQIKLKEHSSSTCKSKYSKDSFAYFDTPTSTSSDLSSHKHYTNTANLNKIYETLQQAISSEQKQMVESSSAFIPNDIAELQSAIAELHNEQVHFCNVIQQQQIYLQDYRSRCDKAKSIMNAQKAEIEKLTKGKKELQIELNSRLDKVRQKLDEKLRAMSPISQQLRDTNLRYEKVVKENRVLMERVRSLQAQAKDFKLKLEELTKRKTVILNKLKNADRDLRVYKNYNAALKKEKLRQTEEIQKTREQLESQQVANKRFIARQRDTNDKHCRDLQRRIYDLEQKLGRSNNSTSGLLQQRDKLISELQTQVNTLVHNFEVSQKHIRVLRRQIVNAASLGNNVVGVTLQRKKA